MTSWISATGRSRAGRVCGLSMVPAVVLVIVGHYEGIRYVRLARGSGQGQAMLVESYSNLMSTYLWSAAGAYLLGLIAFYSVELIVSKRSWLSAVAIVLIVPCCFLLSCGVAALSTLEYAYLGMMVSIPLTASLGPGVGVALLMPVHYWFARRSFRQEEQRR